MANRHIWVYRASDKNIRYDYVTSNTTFVSGSTLYDQLEAIVPTEELTGSNTEQGRDSLNRIISGIIRLVVAPDSSKDIQLYISDGVTQIELKNQSQNFNNGIGDIRWVYGSTCYLRINSLSTDRDIFIFEDTSSTLGILVSPKIPLLVDKVNNPDAVLISNDLKTFLFKTKPLDYENSLRWNLHSTAGMDVEYFKIERCHQGGGVIGSIGEDLVSYKDNDTDQTIHASNISTRYNKSHYGEAQIRVWSANSNQYIQVYYKNYTTGVEYNYNDAPIVYDGVITFNDNGLGCIFNDNGQDITKLDKYKRVKYNTFLDHDNYVEYKTSDLIDYIEVIVNDKTYKIKENTPIYVEDDGTDCGYIMPGIIVNFLKKDLVTNIRVFAVSNNAIINVVPIKLKIKYKNNYLYNDELATKKLTTKNTLVEDDITVETVTNLIYERTCKCISTEVGLNYSLDGVNWQPLNEGTTFTTDGLLYLKYYNDPREVYSIEVEFFNSTNLDIQFDKVTVRASIDDEYVSTINLNNTQYKNIYITAII